jgi:hypothetical protein
MDINKFKTYNLKIITSHELIKKKLITPECQRSLDMEHVNNLLNYQKEYYLKYKEFFFTNPITLCSLDNKEYIIDGQHRAACIEKLYNEKKYPNFNLFLITLEVKNKKEMEEKYVAINKNKPVQLFSNIEEWSLCCKEIEYYIIKNYSTQLKYSENPRTPNINITHLTKYLSDNKIANKINNNYKLFIDEFEKLNDYYKNNIYTILGNVLKRNFSNKISNLMKQKNSALLSLFKNFEWVDRIVYSIENNLEYKDISHYPINYRFKIKKKIRDEVWKKRNNDESRIGECYCCSERLYYDNFVCGHIQSVYFRGETKVSNLEPICSSCNSDMGTKNLIEYKNELQNESL